MNSFRTAGEHLKLSAGSVWLMNTVSEYKGKQELYMKQSPQLLKALVQMALIESAESSNRIEGVTVERKRLRPLIIGHSRPRDRSEAEVAGYRTALDLIHRKHASLPLSPETILELHRLSHSGSGDTGKWKERDNDIIKRNPDGSIEVIFKPVSAERSPEMIRQLCLSYRDSGDERRFPELYAAACLILDFLCIHPFRDGNGRVSRLLTLLALYQHGYQVGKYVSLERKVEESKETYYEALNKSSNDWHQGKHNIEPWLHYFLGVIASAYQEFERRTHQVKSPRGSKTQLLIQAIDGQHGEFSISDIEKSCPGISRDMVRQVLRQLRDEKKIECVSKGKSARWKRMG